MVSMIERDWVQVAKTLQNRDEKKFKGLDQKMNGSFPFVKKSRKILKQKGRVFVEITRTSKASEAETTKNQVKWLGGLTRQVSVKVAGKTAHIVLANPNDNKVTYESLKEIAHLHDPHRFVK